MSKAKRKEAGETYLDHLRQIAEAVKKYKLKCKETLASQSGPISAKRHSRKVLEELEYIEESIDYIYDAIFCFDADDRA